MPASPMSGSPEEHGYKRSLVPVIAAVSDVIGDAMVFNPEDRLSASSWSDSVSSSLSSHMAPQVKRRFVGQGFGGNDEPSPMPHPTPVVVRPMAVRPVAVRAIRPDFPPAHEIPHGGYDVPRDVATVSREDCVSPISCAVSEKSLTSENFMMTLVNRQHEVVHTIEEDASCCVEKPASITSVEVLSARDSVLQTLAISQGDVESEKFKSALPPLLKYFSQKELDTRPHLDGSESVDGMWLSLTKPTFFGCLGENDAGDPMYTLGRMAFDMFSPTNLVCSLQGNFNPVEVVDEEERKAMLELVPKSLREEVESGKTVLRTYNIVTAFTIEPASEQYPGAPNKDVHRPIKGIMTTIGFCLPDPNVENRHSIWFTGGRIEPNSDPRDISEWKRLFTLHPPKHSFGEKAKLLAVKLLMGATIPEEVAQDGSMNYTFTRPLGGHGMAYVDVVYLDETLRIVRGHRGTVMVFSRLPEH